MGSLPQSIVFKIGTTNCYLAVETAEGNQQGCLVPSETAGVFDSIARFVVEPASDGLMHIKSRFNNMYLRRNSEEGKLIAAAASEREENIAKWSCTLFRVDRFESNKCVKLYHAGTGKLILLHMDSGVIGPLCIPGPGDSAIGLVLIVDVEALVRLPRRVSFKGDNGKYLCSHFDKGKPYNSFLGDDNSEEVSHYEIFETRHGDIHIKSLHTNKFLRYDNKGWIVADVDSIEPEKSNPTESFKIFKVGDNVIALQMAGTGVFCARVDGGSWMRAWEKRYVVHEARLVVGEPVFDRRIDVQFHFKLAKIYGKQVSQTATISVINGTDEKHELSQGFSYTKTHTATWGSSDQLKIGTEATLSAGIPFVVKETIKLSTEYTRAWTRGKSEDYSKQLTSTYTVPVPAKTKVTVNLISEEARYDIPYSYYQTDTYANGEKFTTFMNDGIYHGVEAYNFYYQPRYEPLSHDSSDGNILPILPDSDNKIVIPPTLPKLLYHSHPDNKIVLKSVEPPVTPPS